MAQDNEVYIKNCSSDEVLLWLHQELGALRLISCDPITYEASGGRTVVITTDVEGGNITGVYLPQGGFDSDLILARRAHQMTGKVTLCDPEDGDPDPFKWMEVSENGMNTIFREQSAK